MLFSYLNKPYHRSLKGTRFYKFAVIAGLFVALFLMVFLPFGLYSWPHPNKYLIISGYGLVTTIVLMITQIFVERILKHQQWRLWQQALSIFSRVFLIGIANGIYSFAWGMIEPTWSNFLSYIFITFLVGIFPTAGMILFDFFKQKVQSQSDLDKNPENGDQSTITLLDENNSEKVILELENLLYIQSSDNYCKIVTFKNASIRKKLIRGSLKSFNNQIDHPEIINCHRSFLVNYNRVSRYTGNSQGLRLYFSGCDEMVPVSRRYVQNFKKHYNRMDNLKHGISSEKVTTR